MKHGHKLGWIIGHVFWVVKQQVTEMTANEHTGNNPTQHLIDEFRIKAISCGFVSCDTRTKNETQRNQNSKTMLRNGLRKQIWGLRDLETSIRIKWRRSSTPNSWRKHMLFGRKCYRPYVDHR